MATRERLAARRKACGFTQESLARELGVTTGTVAHWERGVSTPGARHRRVLAERLAWSAELLSVVLDSEHVNGHPVPSWLTHLASLEQAAGGVATFEPVVVPGLLQTTAYAFAVETGGPDPITDEDIAHKVGNRIDRQAVLDRDDFHLSAVVDESVLHRTAGGREVMAGQLDHLAEIAEHPAVDLRVLHLDAGVFSAAFGAFTLFTSPGAANPFMACTEDRSGPHYLDRLPELAAHVRLFSHLIEQALSPSASVALIHDVVKEYR